MAGPLTLEAATARYEVVVGVEVHAQLKTRTKLFCGCPTRFGAPPNTQTCPVCLGLPGVLPVLNREAFELCLLAALALGCEVAERTRFDRKNYYYPDQPKNYQISQNYQNLGVNGALELIQTGRRVRITNVHLEEDAGKLLHDAAADGSLVDLNRSGVPLAEIVSGPDMRSLDEVDDYMETLRLTLLHLGVSACRMQEGNLRFEASISLRPHGEERLGKRVEIKNLNSTKAVRGALEHELLRQAAALERGEAISQETRLWDEVALETRRMRSKEEAQDYRYFPEPDLPPVRIDNAWRLRVRERLVELPSRRFQRYKDDMGLSAYEAGVMVADPLLASFFEELAEIVGEPKAAVNWTMNDVLAQCNARGLTMEDWPVDAAGLAELMELVQTGVLSQQVARMTVLPAMLEERSSARAIVEAKGLAQESDPEKLRALAREVLDKNPRPVEQYLGGKQQVLGFLTGQCMKASRGKGNPKVFGQLLAEELERRRPG